MPQIILICSGGIIPKSLLVEEALAVASPVIQQRVQIHEMFDSALIHL